MKTYLRSTLVVLVAMIVSIIMINGCAVDHSLNPHVYGRIYMPQARNNPAKQSVLITDSIQTIIYGAAYGGPGKLKHDIHVHFSVKPALVDSFNKKHLTSYSILPKDSYTLTTKKSIIPSDSLSTPPLKVKLKTKGNLKGGMKYLLPITMSVNETEIQVNKNLQTAYFLISTHVIHIIAKNHDYTAVFPDDGLNPHYLYFIGIPKGSTEQMVWKYDIKNDTLSSGFPKKLTDVFKLPYPKTISKIQSAAWLYYIFLTNKSYKLYFFGNGHYYRYDIKTKKQAHYIRLPIFPKCLGRR